MQGGCKEVGWVGKRCGGGPVARAAAEYFAGLLCSLTSRGQGQVKSSQVKLRIHGLQPMAC
jgi:hypothetical protein